MNSRTTAKPRIHSTKASYPPARQHQRQHPQHPPIGHRGTTLPSSEALSQKKGPTTTAQPPNGPEEKTTRPRWRTARLEKWQATGNTDKDTAKKNGVPLPLSFVFPICSVLCGAHLHNASFCRNIRTVSCSGNCLGTSPPNHPWFSACASVGACMHFAHYSRARGRGPPLSSIGRQ